MISMNRIKIATTFFFFLFFSTFFFLRNVSAQTHSDLIVDTNTTVTYKTGEDFVTIKNEYIRTLKHSQVYFNKDGHKTFHIADLQSTVEEIQQERAFKLNSLTVTNHAGTKLPYKVEELKPLEGMYIHIPYYRVTTHTMPYRIVMTYNTHDYILTRNGLTTIMAHALPKDTVFQKNTSSITTQFNYNLSIVTDKNIEPLAKAFPFFTQEEGESTTTYKFSQEERRGNTPTLEFGTKAKYKFELEYKTPKTDKATPEKYSKVFKAISTNIYQLPLPREFDETKQEVLLENISPHPTNIYRNEEGNVIATFELPANKDDVIKISGYITSERDEYKEDWKMPLHIDFSDYLTKIAKENGNLKYLKAAEYWEVDDKYIQETAKDLLAGKTTLEEIIDADYQFVNDVLDYDMDKANSKNGRIGALKALKGGASVCMEYADSMIAILRAQGIPARAAFGYNNITSEPKKLIGHQWVQIWLPDYGWFSIDPTYESRNRQIGKLIDRVLWNTSNDLSMPDTSVFSADYYYFSTIEQPNYQITIHSVDEIPKDSLMSYEEVLPNKDINENPQHSVVGWFNSLFKTSLFGRAMLIALPIITLIIMVTILVAIVKTSIKKLKSQKKKLSKSV